ACAAALLLVGAGAGAVSYAPLTRALSEVRCTIHARAWPQCPELAVLDVGQGAAILLRTPRRGALLFDGGPADCRLLEQLRAMGIDTLDALVVSHPHADHFAGAKQALDDIDVELLVDCVESREESPGPAATSSPASLGQERLLLGESTSADAEAYYDFRKSLEKTGCRHIVAHTADSLDLHGVEVKLFAPQQPLLLDASTKTGGMVLRSPPLEEAASSDTVNAASVVALLTVGELDVLLPGDAETDVLSQYDLPPVEVLVVPHHGSRDALSRSLLRRLNPQVAVISVGKNNTFAHPHAQTLSFLEEYKTTVLRTDTCGRVCCLLQEDHLTVRCERNKCGEQ
ncbi:MAG: MBL fold metallo-hydrolase, partial [Thermoleophilia bacterium]|nr:MBL fold metallo-hydrolase [Thermoleophilia bacterium]